MQDKDIDQLFKARFEDAEIPPTAGLWNNIQQEINPKQARKLPVFWMAAASVLLAVSAVLLFNKTDKIQLHAQPEIVSNVAPSREQPGLPVASGITLPDESIKPEKNATSRINSVSSVRRKDQARPKEEKSLLVMQPISSESHLVNTESEIKGPEDRLPVKEELPEVQIAVAGTAGPKVVMEEPAAIHSETAGAEQGSRPHIRNAADLVSFVVNKLDKREQKILEFNTDDDDNTSLVAINIGPFKLNTRKHK